MRCRRVQLAIASQLFETSSAKNTLASARPNVYLWLSTSSVDHPQVSFAKESILNRNGRQAAHADYTIR